MFQDAQQQNAPQMQDKMFPQQKESMMSPNRRTPQPSMKSRSLINGISAMVFQSELKSVSC